MKRRYVSTRLLEPGMIIDQSIVDKTNRILIARKIVLEDFHIEALRKMNIAGVYIREGKEDPSVQIEEQPVTLHPGVEASIRKETVADPPMVQFSENLRKRISEDIEHLYSSFSSDDFAKIVTSISDNLMEAVSKNEAIALNINLLKVNNEYTFQHCVDVALISMMIARKSGLSKENVSMIGTAGLLHDIGKSKISNEILDKPDKLTDEEFAIIKEHPALGYEIIKDISGLDQKVKLAVLQHHEKINGCGYPLGLSDSQISPFAKILSVADIYDALVTDRPYKKGLSQRDAVEMIMAMTNDLDIHVMRKFLDSVVLYPVGSTVHLSNGEYARVVQNISHYPLRPKVVALKTGKVYDLCGDIHCANLIID